MREKVEVIEPNRVSRGPVVRAVNFSEATTENADRRYRSGRTALDEPVLEATDMNGIGRVLLDNEIHIGSRLLQGSGHNYCVHLSRLVGYRQVDGQTLVLTEVGGRPLADCAGELTDRDRTTVARSLLDALEALDVNHVVHRQLSPITVWWDKDRSRAQITDFGRAAVHGAPRASGPPSTAWQGPEQRARTGSCDPGDDLYSAALLLFWLYSGEDPDTEPLAMRRRLDRQDAQVAERLSGLFEDAPSDRPSLLELRRRWGPPVGPAPTRAQQREDDEARGEFDKLRADQRADPSPLVDPSAAARARPPRGTRHRAPEPIVSWAGTRLPAQAYVALVVGVGVLFWLMSFLLTGRPL